MEKITIDEYKNYINENCYKFDESLIIAESVYNNIFIENINEEFNSLNEGIASKFLDKIKNFFIKMTLWIKGRYKDLNNFTNKTLVKMKKVFGLISKFAETNENRILEGAKTKEAVAKTLDWYPRLLKLETLENSLKKLQFSDEFESILNDTKEFVNSYFKSENIIETKIDENIAKIAINNAILSNKIDNLIKEYVKSAEAALKETEKASNEGIKNKKDEQSIIESKNKVEEGKKKILTVSKKCSILINLANKAIIDSHRINVACASMYTGGNK